MRIVSQQALKHRRGQRRKQEVDHLTIPLKQEVVRVLHDEQYLALGTVRHPIARAMQAMHYEVYKMTDEQCDVIEVAFRELLLAVRTCIALLRGSDLLAERCPYPLVMNLSALHRSLLDAQVVVDNVRGQCRCGHLAGDPTGSYWHLRMYVRDVARDYHYLLNQFKIVSQVYPLALA